MTLPERVTANWIATLGNRQLVTAETQLHKAFLVEEKQERARCGDRYALLQGPPALVNAWLRWQMVTNEARTRKILVRHRK